MKLETRPWPTIQGDDVLVRVLAAGVNPGNAKIHESSYPFVREDALSITLGREIAGVVETCGSPVQTLK